MRISELFYYPVKSMKGRSIQEAEFDDFGIAGDRRYMVVDSNGDFITQRQEPRLAKITPSISESQVILADFDGQEHLVERSSFQVEKMVRVWGDSVSALMSADKSLDCWLSSFLGYDVQVAYLPDDSERRVDPVFATEGELVSFADGFPLLICNESSLDDLNTRLGSPIRMSRFRPNIVLSGAEPYAESDWRKIRVGGLRLDLVKPCARCSITTLDESGGFNKEPLKTLATYRRNEFGVCFGENALIITSGTIRVGDSVEILE